MSEDAPQERGDDRVIRTPDDLATALTEQLLANWDAGDYAANDDLVQQLGEWKRRNR